MQTVQLIHQPHSTLINKNWIHQLTFSTQTCSAISFPSGRFFFLPIHTSCGSGSGGGWIGGGEGSQLDPGLSNGLGKWNPREIWKSRKVVKE